MVFREMLVAEFLGDIPKQVNENAIGVMGERKEKLEKWLLWQAYLVQRKAVSDLRRADYYFGVLSHIKILLSLISSVKSVDIEPVQSLAKKEDMSEVLSIIKKFRDKNKIIKVSSRK